MIVIFVFTGRNEVAKVMFLQASVCPQGGGGVCLSACWDTTPPGSRHPLEWTPPPGSRHPLPGSRHTPQSRHPSRADTPPLEQTPPQSRHPPRADTPRDTATAADGTHPTGMHSCFINIRSELTWYYQNGASNIYPDVWDEYLEPIPEVSLIIVCCDAVWFA